MTCSEARSQFLRVSRFIGQGMLTTALFMSPAFSQVPANNPNEMCGDGSTFTVNLPGQPLGIDDSEGIFRAVNVPPVGPDDSVTIPNGCSVYVLLVSGYNQNKDFDRITFFKVADFAAKHNGYVHVAWWNNMLKEYMGGLLHPATITIQRFLLPDLNVTPNPGGYDFVQIQAMLFPSDFVNLPKANPDENFQFVSDATLMIQAIKANNPNALIVLVGHSMGADSVAWVGRNPQLPIDLLAVIDPGNNRDLPRGSFGTPQFNWTRWRATHDFAGYKRWDCVRNSIGLCRNFGTFFHPSFQCVPSGDFLNRPPLITTLAPIVCPIFQPFADPGTVRTIGENVKHLYFRWQHEYFFPFDFLADYNYNYPAPLSGSILDPNYQQPILTNGLLGEDPNKTCGDPLAYDPRRGPGFACSPFDGHGEIVGFRAPQNDLLNPNPHDLEGLGLVMQNWPADAAGRRSKMIEMVTADASWPQRPVDPDLCMVCDDIIAIMQNLIDQQGKLPGQDTTPPTTVATANPGPNVNGWNMQDVLVNLHAADNPDGSGVSQISYSAAGAQVIASTVVNGASASVAINTEGITTVTFFATDNAGNVEAPKMLVIQLDKTPPTITGSASPAPNANGWNNTNVTVSFQCSDSLSGLATGSPPPQTVLSAEGAGQSVSGSCQDLAGNAVGTTVSDINIDKTPPAVACVASPNILRPPDNKLVPVNVDVTVTDSLSGSAGFDLVSVTSSEPDSGLGDIHGFAVGSPSASGQLRAQRLGSGVGRTYMFTYSGADRAGNSASCSTTVSVPHDHGN